MCVCGSGQAREEPDTPAGVTAGEETPGSVWCSPATGSDSQSTTAAASQWLTHTYLCCSSVTQKLLGHDIHGDVQRKGSITISGNETEAN